MEQSQNLPRSAAIVLETSASERLVRPRPLGGWVKRAFDFTGSAALLVALSPVLLICAAGVRLSSRGPALYGHERVGLAGDKFKCLKFRSMRTDADEVLADLLERDTAARDEWERTQKLAEDPRVTRFGAFLRRTSLDELPQLFNVLLGHMSLVGPRPVTEAELRRYGDYVAAYLVARPGITGLWQISGRSSTSYDQRVAFDRSYVQAWNLSSDIKILFKTIGVVLRRDGAV